MKKHTYILGDQDIEQWIGKLLRYGVISSCLIAIAGGILYLITFGQEIPKYTIFIGESPEFTSLPAILRGFLTLQSKAIIQFGVVILIATPILRIVLSLIAFMLEKDKLYVIITTIVLSIILVSMFGGLKI